MSGHTMFVRFVVAEIDDDSQHALSDQPELRTTLDCLMNS